MAKGGDFTLDSILKHVDHTLLKQTDTWDEIRQICLEGIQYKTASVCIPPNYVKQAAEYVKQQIPICTVIGFPNGYQTTACKVFEATRAIESGAEEIDMVIPLGWVKDKLYEEILQEMIAVKKACGDKILKVIVETCFLTQEEKIKLAHIVNQSGADFIKTSTGFGGAGAQFDDVVLFSSLLNGTSTRIKAAGGIKSLADAQKFLELGAERLGSSSIVGFMQKKV